MLGLRLLGLTRLRPGCKRNINDTAGCPTLPLDCRVSLLGLLAMTRWDENSGRHGLSEFLSALFGHLVRGFLTSEPL
jgi:hypothetical protein